MAASFAENCSASVPIAEIEDAKRSFPDSEFSYEVLVEFDAALPGIAECAAAFSVAGLACAGLRYGGERRAAFTLRDESGGDLRALADAFGRARAARLVSWTTVIGAIRAPIRRAG